MRLSQGLCPLALSISSEIVKLVGELWRVEARDALIYILNIIVYFIDFRGCWQKIFFDFRCSSLLWFNILNFRVVLKLIQNVGSTITPIVELKLFKSS